ncbi:flagellar basal body-associated FliL family protein [Ammoniphilus resinae]|uniref:Flagellar protein FliL n=1 Tax=Ammoniphilus resinae TaxID=861532 RepID=A0ABS4GMF2_9BACL|nr:flagellar basal body-associated FliL family protein [Ammoniphilus resinae]MBP1931451.1 flagellar FliL protein [Ammoniphilus resinae]
MKLYLKSFIILIGISVLIIGAFALWESWTAEPAAKGENQSEVSAAELVERTVETAVITTNLYDEGWIKTKFAIQTDSPETKEHVEKTMFQTESLIIKTLSQLSKDKLAGAEGLALVENSIQKKLNQMLGGDGDQIVKVYTTDRVIQ